MSESGENSKLGLWAATITAGGAVLAAVVGLFTGVVEVPILSGAPGSSDLQVTVKELDGKISQLEQENQDLRAELDKATSVSSTGPSSPVSDKVRETDTPITLSNYSCLDLDSEAPNWDANDDYHGDLCFTSGSIEGENLTVFEEEPDQATCAARTELDDSLPAEELLDSYVCADASSGDSARVHVTGVDAGNDISFDITVWK